MYGCMWHVVVGENFTANITAEVQFKRKTITLFYFIKSQENGFLSLIYGSFYIFVWKCGTQLLKETVYKEIGEITDKKKKGNQDKGSKYAKILY